MNEYQEAQADAQAIEGAPAPQPPQPTDGKGKTQDRITVSHQASVKRVIALEMIAGGATLYQVARRLGYDRRSKVVQLLERGGVRIPRRVLNEVAAKRADDSESDPSSLTEAQLERAFVLGITPGRFAYLLTCEHGASPFSHPAPGNAYTRNIL